ncbi:MAG: glycosyltransferase family 39 protein [Anaerolineales bacterium]|nr:glycosyltransferase family 39 protein [Anaerolineales bacterium]
MTIASPRLASIKQSSTLALLLILLLAAFLRFYNLTGSSLWSDEGNTWAMTGRSFGAIAQAAAADIHPPGYYWLLKSWTLIFGATDVGMRSLSAVIGILLVYAVAGVARHMAPDPGSRTWLPLLAAFLAAVSPFQIYYSQEARMYILLALEATGLFWALLAMSAMPESIPAHPGRTQILAPQIGFVVCGVAGLWTHYSFPIVLGAAGLAYLLRWLAATFGTKRNRERQANPVQPSLMRFIVLNGIIVLAFLPWLPQAIDSVLHWPKGGVEVGWQQGLTLTLRTLLFGPIRQTPEPLWPWLVVAAILPLLGLVALRTRWQGLVLGLWLLLPIGMMALLGLYSDAFLKFLLVTSPAWCLAAAAAALLLPVAWPGIVVVSLFGAAAGVSVLPAYYADPAVRDNYKGVAAYLAAIGDPNRDLVLLDAPGQQEVWRYYDPGLPILGLPQQRPADAEATTAALEEATANKQRIFALLWATDEADPDRLVEGWLAQHAFPGLDTWQGNLRLATYAMPPQELVCGITGPVAFGDGLTLADACLPATTPVVTATDVLPVRLIWQAQAAVSTNYKVTLQLLDARNQVIAQRDAEPMGGTLPATAWQVGEKINDQHGVTIPPGTPPGEYQLIAALYDPATGVRLPVGADRADRLELGMVQVARAAQPLPAELIPVQNRVNAQLGPVQLVGYDLYKRDFAHAPATPLQPGDTLHVTLYWRAPDPLPADWPDDLAFTLSLGGQSITAPLAGGAYASGLWSPGELVRGEVDLAFDGSDRRPRIAVGDGTTVLQHVPVQ